MTEAGIPPTHPARWRGRRRRRIFLAAGALVVLALLALVVPNRAHAASTYRVLECNPVVGPQPAVPDLKSRGYDGNVIQFGVTCNSRNPSDSGGWARGIVLHPTAFDVAGHGATAELDAPAGTYINAGSLRWDLGARGPCAAGSCWYAAVYVGHENTPVYAYGMGASPTAGYSVWTNCGTACTRIWEDLTCSQSCVHFASDPGGNPNEWWYDYAAIRELDLTLVDTANPTLALSGSLFDSQIGHGAPTLQISATDFGGGVRAATVEVNGRIIAEPLTDCPGIGVAAPFADRFRPCGNLVTTIQLDTEKTPWRDGQNTLRVCASDVATGPGAPNTTCEQRTVFVDNSCPDSSGASGQADSLAAGLEDPQTGQLRRTRTVRSSQGTALRGQLTGSGGPVKAASVCVYETVDEPAGITQLVQVARSSSKGQFGVELPGGPSRTFQVAYRYGDRQLESPSMYLESSVFPTLRLTKSTVANGHFVGFRGRVPGPNADGRAVTLQARVGKKWRSFKQVQTDPIGRFRGKYRFTQTRGRVLYVFRALVKKQGGYPYSPGASRKRKLLVHG